MSDSKKERAWKRYFDSENQAYYWYNQQTGQSRWEEDDIPTEAESNPLLSSSYYVGEQPPAPSMAPLEIESTTSKTSINRGKEGDNKKKKKKSKKVQPYEESFNDVEARREEPAMNEVDEVDEADESGADYDMICYARFAKCNAFLFEAPFCVLEASLRIAVLSSLLLAFAMYSLIVHRKWDRFFLIVAKRILRDIALTSAAALSLFLPGMIWYVYSSYKSLNPWKLRRIPSLLGPVDPRRFMVISTFGMGSMAANASVDLTVLHRDCMDKWSDSCLYFPRNVVEELRRFVNGRKSLESMEVALAVPDL